MKSFVRLHTLYTFVIFLILSCSHKPVIISNEQPQVDRIEPTVPEIIYYVDNNDDGEYEVIAPEEKPIPLQGKVEFTSSVYRFIKYPNMAKEYNIAGIVILEVTVDEKGFVQEVKIKKDLKYGCGEESRKAFINATTKGYAPLKVNSEFKKYKMDYPVMFWLG